MTAAASAAYWNGIARKYSRRPVPNPDAYAETLRRIRARLSPRDRVLELGCGTGSTALTLTPHVARYAAVDVAEEMIAIAREKDASGAVAFSVIDAEARAAPVVEGGWDAVLALNLYHLTTDLDGALSRAASLLRPGGHLISKTPCLAEQWWLRPIAGAMRLFGKAPAIAFLSTRELEAAIKRAGFEIIEADDLPAPSRLVIARKQ